VRTIKDKKENVKAERKKRKTPSVNKEVELFRDITTPWCTDRRILSITSTQTKSN